MNPIRTLARPMLASMFVVGGINAVRDPRSLASAARPVVDEVGEVVPAVDDMTTDQAVRANGAVQVVAGLLYAIGKAPRLASTALAATLVPTTLAGHRFWEESDPQARQQQQVHFLKNVSMMGGLLVAANDTEGEANLLRRAGYASELASTKAGYETELLASRAGREKDLLKARAKQSGKQAKLAAKLAKAEAKAAAGGDVRRQAKLAGKLAKAEAKAALAGNPKRQAKLASELVKARAEAAVSGDPKREAKLTAQLAKERAKNTGLKASKNAQVAAASGAGTAAKKWEEAKLAMTPTVADLWHGITWLFGDDEDDNDKKSTKKDKKAA